MLSEAQIKKKACDAEYYRKNREKCRANNHARYLTHKVEVRAYDAAWSAANPERVKEIRRGINKRWYDKNKVADRARRKEYYAANRERQIAYTLQWAKENPEKVQANKTRRKFRKENQLHPELNCAVETALFLRAQKLTQETGIIHHVDHIIPLELGGWHHHLNLQVLPGAVNISKHSDPFWEKPRYKSWRDVPEHLWPCNLVRAYQARLLI